MNLKLRGLAAATFGIVVAGPVVAQDLEWTLINDSGATLVELYASPTTTDDWQEDLMAGDTLESGYSGTVTIADGETVCDYDLRLVFDDGSTLEDTVNMCEMGSYTINP